MTGGNPTNRRAAGLRPAVFFDRDGVINVSPGVDRFVLSWEEFRFVPGAAAQLRRLKERGFFLVLVTNQSCVGRGLMTRETLEDIHGRMQAALGQSAFDALYYCHHHPQAGCRCRKPSPWLILRACAEHGLDPRASFLVGDSMRDIEMGRAAGCRTIFCGEFRGHDPDFQTAGQSRPPAGWGVMSPECRPDHQARTLRAAVEWILGQRNSKPQTPNPRETANGKQQRRSGAI